MARLHTFPVRGEKYPNLSAPDLSVPSDHKLHQGFIVSFLKHYSTIDVSLGTFSLTPASETRFYACCIQYWPCCSEGIPEHEVEQYVYAALNANLCHGR